MAKAKDTQSKKSAIVKPLTGTMSVDEWLAAPKKRRTKKRKRRSKK
ncbi:MAG: hypothetical protein WB581_11290 [Halobacteriota archaeon]